MYKAICNGLNQRNSIWAKGPSQEHMKNQNGLWETGLQNTNKKFRNWLESQVKATCSSGPVNHGSKFINVKMVPGNNRNDHAG